jgi:hypothetical protein
MFAYSHCCQTVLGGISHSTATTTERSAISIFTFTLTKLCFNKTVPLRQRDTDFESGERIIPRLHRTNSFLIIEYDHHKPECIPSGIHPEGRQSLRTDLYQQLTGSYYWTAGVVRLFPTTVEPTTPIWFSYETSLLDLLKYNVPRNIMRTQISKG